MYSAAAFLLSVCILQFIIILKIRNKREASAQKPEMPLCTVEETISKAEEAAGQKKQIRKDYENLQKVIYLLSEVERDEHEAEDIADNSLPPEPEPEPQKSCAPFENVKVLVCEDYEQNREVMGGMLEEFGIKPEFAANGMECVSILNSGKMFDMIFMDLQMPLMDGYEAARSIRSNSKFDSTPIISMTANVMREIVNKCFETGMNDHIAKPVEFDRLEYVLEKWLPENRKISI
jgi:CheY-like chemotaxis protein